MISNVPDYHPPISSLSSAQIQPTNSAAMLYRQSRDAATFSWLSMLGILALIMGTAWWVLTPMIIGCGGGPARESEGRSFIGAMGRGQQAFFLENNHFTSNFQALQIGANATTENYVYSSSVQGDRVFNYAVAQGDVTRSYVGAVFLMEATTQSPENIKENLEFATIICSVNIRPDENPVDLKTVLPTLNGDLANCHSETTLVMRSPDSPTISQGVN